MTRKICTRILFSLATTLATATVVASAESPDSSTALVAACRAEAVRGHARAVSYERLRHFQEMSALCSAWLSVRPEEKQQLLARCLDEADGGAIRGPVDRRTHQSHVYRLKMACRSLAQG
jgi:hypothetical protein